MGNETSNGGPQSPLGKFVDVSQNIPELFRFITCDIRPEEDEVHAEIASWPSNRNGSFDSQVVDKRRPQPSQPMGVGQRRAKNLARAEDAHMHTPTRDCGAAPGCASLSPGQKVAHGPYKAGDAIELFSKSQQAWCRGSIDRVDGTWVHILYSGPEGQPMTKIMPNGHEELRVPQGQPQNRSFPQGQPSCCSPPPPPPPLRPDAPGQSPARSPPHSMQMQSPMPLDVHTAASPSEPGPSSGAVFNLPGLTSSLPDAQRSGGPPSPSPPADAFGNRGGGMEHFGAVRLQRQPMQGPSTPQSTMAPKCFQASPGLTPTQSTPQGWQGGMAQSPAPSQGSVAIAPGALGAFASPCAASPSQPSSSKKKYEEPDVPNKVPLIAGIERIEPEVVCKLLQSGQCVLIDVRGDDRAVGVIPDSIHIQAVDSTPFTQKLPGMLQRFQNESLVVFTCQYSAHRAPQCANWYREQADPRQRVAILSGGYRAWEGNGLPVEASSNGDKYAADAYALLQGVQFAQQSAGVGGQAGNGSYSQQRWV